MHNTELAKVNFPGCKLRVYNGMLAGNSRLNLDVPAVILTYLQELGAEIKFIDLNTSRISSMMWRFFVADYLTVDRFIVRDCDARLTKRD